MQAASHHLSSTPTSNAKAGEVSYRLLTLTELAASKSSQEDVIIRYVHSGSLRCRLHQYHFSLKAGQYLLANPGQQFVMTQSHGQAEVLEVQISLAALQNVPFDAVVAEEDQLEAFYDRKGKLSLCEGSYNAEDDQLGVLLTRLTSQLASPAASSQDSGAALAQALLETQQEIFTKINRLTSAKLSTKKELYRRLMQAQEYIHENLHTNLDLDTLSQVACLSKFHFIRLFKEVFEQTPRQYLIACRLERASKLLLNSSKSFHEICLDVGLKDSSSFGRLFKKNFGATPHIYRRIYAQAG
ncbi:MAG: AraC family transcriptional regulator [Bacteroidota bacterium]